MCIYVLIAPELRKATAIKVLGPHKDKNLQPISTGTYGSALRPCVPIRQKSIIRPNGGPGRISAPDGQEILDATFLMRCGKGLISNLPLPYRQGYSNPGRILRKGEQTLGRKATTLLGCFPGNDMTEGSQLQVEWFDGEFYPPEEVRALYSLENYPAESAMLIGTKGALLIPHTQMPVLLPEADFQQIQF